MFWAIVRAALVALGWEILWKGLKRVWRRKKVSAQSSMAALAVAGVGVSMRVMRPRVRLLCRFGNSRTRRV